LLFTLVEKLFSLQWNLN